MKPLAPLLPIILLTSCNTIENHYVDATGKLGSGQTTMSVTQSDGKFSIADEAVACSGTFDSWANATVVFPVNCTNGKSGSVVMTRPTANGSLVAGEGTIQFVTGESRRFTFGPTRFN